MPSDPVDLDAETVAFTEHRQTLFQVAYRMLGSVADTEDVLQEVWLSWASSSRDEVENPRAYLIRTTVNESLRRLGRAQRRRETYVGPWLPEPLVEEAEPDAADPAVRADDISMALLVVLETLGPLERAVFILRETFGYDYAEIGRILDRKPAAVRQLAHRARGHVRAGRPRFDADPQLRKAATERFMAATLGGNLDALLEVLAPDVTLWTDGGGVVRAARQVVSGRDKVGRLIAGLVERGDFTGLEYRQVEVNGDPGVLISGDGESYGIMLVELAPDGEHIQEIYGIINPDKLRGVNL
ncbi:RNA polymerase sigma factor SigJ [Solicola gregarius]|uniref:RNA polymerase sigma factor SigJ n=1 Tax=Solicola gregarius TaxID=2908642 RepID=A0AA46YJY6_9ACTN|nr:RNA polymerase sigma factor SigJ [Solicola gregarius]UYM04064.1 RNA polymerase sigma factor SigJ [Solicola gregarius]